MTPAIRALLAIVDDLDNSYVDQRIRVDLTDEEQELDVRVYLAALHGLKLEEDAARVRISHRTYAAPDGAPLSGEALLAENDGLTFGDVFRIDDLEAGDTADLYPSDSAESGIRRIS